MNDDDIIVLSDDNLFWHSSAYRRELFINGVDTSKYRRADGSRDTTVFRSLDELMSYPDEDALKKIDDAQLVEEQNIVNIATEPLLITVNQKPVKKSILQRIITFIFG